LEERKEPMIASREAVLLGDIGATNARFAVLIDGMLGPIEWIEVAHHPTFDGAVKDFLQSHGRDYRIAHALLAIAGPVKDDRCKFTNCPWTIDSRDLRNQFRFQSVQLVNDFEATALSLPHLTSQDLRSIGEGSSVLGAPMVCLGPALASALPDWFRMELTTWSWQLKVATPRWPPSHPAKMRSLMC
jgi:glucokinase